MCSGGNAPLVRALGADRVIDYAREDFAGGGRRYDLILDMIANRSLADLRRAMTPRGRLVLVGAAGNGRWLGPLAAPLRALLVSPFVRQKLLPYVARVSRDDLLVLQGLLAAGKVTPVIDRTYKLSEVPQAIEYLEQGHARGKVVIAVA